MNGANINNAPSPYVVLPFYGTASIFWFLVCLLLFIFPEFLRIHFSHPSLVAITHIIVLGVITMVIFGALHQLVPVFFQKKIFNEHLGFGSYLLLTSGTLILTGGMFFLKNPILLVLGGSLIIGSFASLAVNLFSVIQLNQKEPEKILITTSLFYLTLTPLIGITLVFVKYMGFSWTIDINLLKLHVVSGLFGWLLQLIMGVSSILLPMFFLHHPKDKKLLMASFILLNATIISVIASLFLAKSISNYLLFTGIPISILLFLIFIVKSYKGRIKKLLDNGLRISTFSLVNLAVLILFCALSFQFYKSEMELFYKSMLFIYLVGFIIYLILGQTFKTLPFIIWLWNYKSIIGKEKIPLPKDLYSERSVSIIKYSHLLGLSIVVVGFYLDHLLVLRTGFFFLSTAAFFYTQETFKLIFHKKITT